jgi:hypothetical protein
MSRKGKNVTMVDTNPARALDVVKRVIEMCDFIEHPAIQEAIKTKMVPVSMPDDVNSVLKISVWVGLGTVGLWAALDAFAERAGLPDQPNPIRFRCRCEGNEEQSLKELDDIRHLYAHNYAGEADDEYFNRGRRYVLCRGEPTQLTCGAQFDGRRLSLNLQDLRWYAQTVQTVLRRFAPPCQPSTSPTSSPR